MIHLIVLYRRHIAMSLSHSQASCVTLAVSVYNGAKKFLSSMPVLLYLFKFRSVNTTAVYNIQCSGIQYRFTAEKPQDAPYSLLWSKLAHCHFGKCLRMLLRMFTPIQ